jgi:hypothetical protein
MFNFYRIAGGAALAFFTFAQFNGYTMFGSGNSGHNLASSRTGGSTYIGGSGGRSSISHK